MAVIQQNQQDDDNENNNQYTTGGGAGGSITGGMGGGQAPGNPTARKARQGGFVGINRYMQAQQGAGGKMAEKIAGNLENQGTQARQAIGGLQQNFQTKSAQDIEAKKQALNTLKSDVGKFGQDQATQLQSGYQGPGSLQALGDYGKTAEQVRGLETSLGQTQSGAGRQNLTRKQFGGAGYTGGMGRLDSALIGVDESARNRFAGLRQSMGDVGTQLGGAEEQAQTLANQRQAEALAIQNQATDSIQGQRAKLEENLAATQAKTNADAMAEFERKKELLKGGKYSGEMYKVAPEDQAAAKQYHADRSALMNQMGLSSQDIQRMRQGSVVGLENQSLDDYIKGPGEHSISQAATEDQRAKDAALARVAGMFGMAGQTNRFTGDDVKGPAGMSLDTGKLAQRNLEWNANAQTRDQNIASKRLAEADAKMKLQQQREAELERQREETRQRQLAKAGLSAMKSGVNEMRAQNNTPPNLATAINRW